MNESSNGSVGKKIVQGVLQLVGCLLVGIVLLVISLFVFLWFGGGTGMLGPVA